MSAITPAEYVAKIEQATESLAAPTVAKLHQAYDVWLGGAFNTADLAAVLSSVLLLANAHARSVGDLMAAAGVGLLGGGRRTAPVRRVTPPRLRRGGVPVERSVGDAGWRPGRA